MKVICIDAIGAEMIVEQQLYNAHQCPQNGMEDCYMLDEIPFCWCGNHRIAFNKSRFIPLSEIDEVELSKERELVKS